MHIRFYCSVECIRIRFMVRRGGDLKRYEKELELPGELELPWAKELDLGIIGGIEE